MLDAHIQWFLAHSFAEWDDAIVVLCQDGADHVGYQFEGKALGALWREHTSLAELIPHLDRVHAMVVTATELFPTIVVLIELVEVGDLWLLVVDGEVRQMLPNLWGGRELRVLILQPCLVSIQGSLRYAEVAHRDAFLVQYHLAVVLTQFIDIKDDTVDDCLIDEDLGQEGILVVVIAS